MTTKGSNNPFPSILLNEVATDGSDTPTPAADYRRLFLGEDGYLHTIDSADVVQDAVDVSGAAGSVATDTIWDAAGDLAVGSGANTAAKLTIGATNGMVLRRVSGAVAWDLPPGHEFDYVEKTSDTAVTNTTEATADTVVTGNAVTYDGSTIVLIEFFANYWNPDSGAAGRSLSLYLYDGSSSIGRIGFTRTPAAAFSSMPIYVARRLTPSNASHTYSIRAACSAGTLANIGAGAGGNGNAMPAFIRITKV